MTLDELAWTLYRIANRGASIRKLEAEGDSRGGWGNAAIIAKLREENRNETEALEASPEVDRLWLALRPLGRDLTQDSLARVCEEIRYRHGLTRDEVKALTLDEAITKLAPPSPPPPPPPAIRDVATEARDKYIYDQWQKGTPEPQIRAKVNSAPGWGKLKTKEGIKRAAERYATRHELDPPAARKPGRKKSTEVR